jgi:hypothetical protein
VPTVAEIDPGWWEEIKGWQWQKREMGTVKAGKHIFRIRNRKRASAMDKVLLITDASYAPSGSVESAVLQLAPQLEQAVLPAECQPVTPAERAIKTEQEARKREEEKA